MSPHIAAYLDFIRAHAERNKACAASSHEDDAPSAAFRLDAGVEDCFSEIQSLPLFSRINPDALRNVLREARIVTHEKGDVFVAQGRTVNNLHILLEGWVKIYKTGAYGRESVLHVLGRTECLADVDILHPSNSPISAAAVAKIRLLSIPATSIRRSLAQPDCGLALNLLAAATQHIGRLINQFEQLSMHSATERVGWFLLNLRLDGKTETEMVLPFDKALIAAWLGLTPETFSRALLAFRKNGFKIDRHRVIAPNARALCGYCDYETAQKCPNIEMDDCVHANNGSFINKRAS